MEALTEPAKARESTAPVLSVVVPTRNEAHSVGPLMLRLAAALGDYAHEVIFVDDSDDGTDGVLQDLAENLYPQLRVLHRFSGERADGLSGAVIEGFRTARGAFVAVIDADLQHPPELLPRMLDELQARDVDIVIASRYLGDGSADGLADPGRRLASRATAFGTRLLFAERVRGITDPASGYFVMRRSLLEDIHLRPLGYKILLEVLMRTPWRTAYEVPYRFSEREADASKASLRQGVIFLRHCVRLLREIPAAGMFWKLGLAAGALVAVTRLFRRFIQPCP